MREIRIKELKLRNFKGIKDFTLSPECKNVSIYGENATGKTSIMDAFIWLLFNKDSRNSSQFNIKTLDDEGNVLHGLEHEVSAKLEIDSIEIELQKIYKEKWQKKRGQAESTLTGHTTDYFINSVPKKKSEYDDYLANIIDEDTFKILTNPLFFNENLRWQDRRNIALSICGEVEDSEVIKQDEKLEGLEKLLVDKSIDDLKAEMTARRRKLNEELRSIPHRIDELSRSNVEVDIDTLKRNKKELEGELAELKSDKGPDYDFQIRGVNGSINLLENELREMEQNAVSDLREDLNKVLDEINKIKNDSYKEGQALHEIMDKEVKLDKERREIENELKKLREEFSQLRDTEFNEDSTICPTCKQSLPAEEIEDLKSKFEEDKTSKLSGFNVRGKELNQKLEDLLKKLEETRGDRLEKGPYVEMIEQMLQGKNKEKEELEKQISNVDIKDNQAYKEKQAKLKELYERKKHLKEQSQKQDKSEDIRKLEDEISTIDKELAKVDLAKDNEKRVDELKSRERGLAQMVADTERVEFMAEQFTIQKAGLLEGKLNDMFDLVKFKLFDVQVNGGINETFVTTVEGVPFEDLNNAMKINAGLDIINTLTDYYNFKAPIFVDNAESVNELLEVDSQVIRLIVSRHKHLRVEVK